MRYSSLLFILILFSCSLLKGPSLRNEHYSATLIKEKNPYRKLEIIMKDSVNCELINTYYCKDLPEEYRVIKQRCFYYRYGKNILLVSIEDDSSNQDYIKIPPQENLSCDVFSQRNRTRIEKRFGPVYLGDYEKYCLIPRIKKDTLFYLGVLNNKRLYYIKKPAPFGGKHNWMFVFVKD